MKRKSRIILLLFIISIVLIIITLMFINNTKAIYAKQSNWNYMYETSSIYIDSSLIKNDAKYVYNNYDGSNISFLIKNYLEDSLVSSASIEYELECSSDNQLVSCLVDTSSNTFISSGKCYNQNNLVLLEKEDCIKKGYQFVLDKQSYEHSVKVTRNDSSIESANVTLLLKVKKPYTKEITTTLILNFSSNDGNIINFGLRKENKNLCNYFISNKFNTNKTILLLTNNNFFLENNELLLAEGENKQIRLYKKNISAECNSNNLSYAIVNIDNNIDNNILNNLKFEIGGSLLSGVYSGTRSYLDNKYYSVSLEKTADISEVNLEMNIYLRVNSMDQELQSSLVHWYLTEEIDNTENLISKGDFTNVLDNSDINILSNIPLSTSNRKFLIRIWVEDNLLQNKNIDIFPYFEINSIS